MKKIFTRAASCVLILLILSSTLLLGACAAPDIEQVREEFTRLIKESLEINEILFGKGLSCYNELSYNEEKGVYYTVYYTKRDGKLCAYRDAALGKYVVLAFGDADGADCVYKNQEKGIYLYPTELEYTNVEVLPDAPFGYRFVREDERCTSLNEIAALAAEIYSEDYLSELFAVLFGNEASAESVGSTASPKYIEKYYESKEKTFLLCANEMICPVRYDGSRAYDYDSMTIGKRSRSSYVNIEIRAYGRYADTERGEISVGWHTVRLSFTRQGNEWRLDTATY